MTADAGRGISVTHAKLKPVTDQNGAQLSEGDKDAQAVEVQFNPETLDITLSNNFKESSGDSPTQLVDEASAQLSLELQFDTTDTGVDVRQKTHEVAKFLKPLDITMEVERGDPLPPPMVVEFDWGAILFQGYMDSYSETLEFFSHDGVPLRAKVSVSLTQQERSFDPRQGQDSEGNETGPYSNDAVNNDPFASGAVEQDVDPNAPMDNAASAANGVENPRQPGVDKVAMPEKSGQLGRAPAAFAQAGASLGAGLGGGLSAGIGAGIGAGAGISAVAGVDFGASAGAGIGASAGAGFGVSAGAGFGASAGARFGAGAGAVFGGRRRVLRERYDCCVLRALAEAAETGTEAGEPELGQRRRHGHNRQRDARRLPQGPERCEPFRQGRHIHHFRGGLIHAGDHRRSHSRSHQARRSGQDGAAAHRTAG